MEYKITVLNVDDRNLVSFFFLASLLFFVIIVDYYVCPYQDSYFIRDFFSFGSLFFLLLILANITGMICFQKSRYTIKDNHTE